MYNGLGFDPNGFWPPATASAGDFPLETPVTEDDGEWVGTLGRGLFAVAAAATMVAAARHTASLGAEDELAAASSPVSSSSSPATTRVLPLNAGWKRPSAPFAADDELPVAPQVALSEDGGIAFIRWGEQPPVAPFVDPAEEVPRFVDPEDAYLPPRPWEQPVARLQPSPVNDVLSVYAAPASGPSGGVLRFPINAGWKQPLPARIADDDLPVASTPFGLDEEPHVFLRHVPDDFLVEHPTGFGAATADTARAPDEESDGALPSRPWAVASVPKLVFDTDERVAPPIVAVDIDDSNVITTRTTKWTRPLVVLDTDERQPTVADEEGPLPIARPWTGIRVSPIVAHDDALPVYIPLGYQIEDETSGVLRSCWPEKYQTPTVITDEANERSFGPESITLLGTWSVVDATPVLTLINGTPVFTLIDGTPQFIVDDATPTFTAS